MLSIMHAADLDSLISKQEQAEHDYLLEDASCAERLPSSRPQVDTNIRPGGIAAYTALAFRVSAS